MRRSVPMSAVAEPRRAVGRLLVCPPDYFDTHYLFNPFMTYRERVDSGRAATQWRRLVRALEEAGAAVEHVEPSPATSALPFTADTAFCYAPGRALVLRNDGLRGDLEPRVVTRWLRALGYVTEGLPPRYRLEGGNLVRNGPRELLVGLKPGATGLSERYLAKLVGRVAGIRVTPVQLVDERHLHLDTVVGVLEPRLFLVYRDGLAERRLPVEGEVLEVNREDARAFACNLVRVGDVVVTGLVSAGLERRIRRLGLEVERVDLSEFHKAGGGAKCLTLPLE
jgi:N-dimethylarginine dimethylaminohydrolase